MTNLAQFREELGRLVDLSDPSVRLFALERYP